MPFYPCKRKNVYALLLLPTGEYYTGQNLRLNDIDMCPRYSAAPSEMYTICQTVCDTIGHAEAVAIALALERHDAEELGGSKMWIFGHNYQCENCKALCAKYGITVVSITDLGEQTCPI